MVTAIVVPSLGILAFVASCFFLWLAWKTEEGFFALASMALMLAGIGAAIVGISKLDRWEQNQARSSEK